MNFFDLSANPSYIYKNIVVNVRIATPSNRLMKKWYGII